MKISDLTRPDPLIGCRVDEARIVGAAFRDFNTGKIYRSGVHHDLSAVIRDMGLPDDSTSIDKVAGDLESGFVTDQGEFLTRTQALDRVKAPEPLKKRRYLGSEHLKNFNPMFTGSTSFDMQDRARLDRIDPELSEAAIEFSIHSRAYHSGQQDLTLKATVGGKTVGYIEYADYQDEPHVQMIKVASSERRKGYGTALMRKLQSMYPGIEINWGGMTPDGSALKSSLPTDSIDNPDVMAKMKELEKLKAKEAAWTKRFDKENFTDQDRAELHAITDEWNEMNSRIWELEQELRDAKASKTLIKTSTP